MMYPEGSHHRLPLHVCIHSGFMQCDELVIWFCCVLSFFLIVHALNQLSILYK